MKLKVCCPIFGKYRANSGSYTDNPDAIPDLNFLLLLPL